MHLICSGYLKKEPHVRLSCYRSRMPAPCTRPIFTSVNISSYPWRRKDPQGHGHARPESHLPDLRARVADLDSYARSVAVMVLATEVVRHSDASEAVAPVVPSWTWVPVARTVESCAANGIFAPPRKPAASSRLRAPCFCLLFALRLSVHSTRSTCPLSGWGSMMTPVRGTRLRPWLWVSWQKSQDERWREQEGWVWGVEMERDANSVRDPRRCVLSL
jgi:hypothetical protein